MRVFDLFSFISHPNLVTIFLTVSSQSVLGRTVRILLVEDNKHLSCALRQGLEEDGFAVDSAEDGEEADHKAARPTTMRSSWT